MQRPESMIVSTAGRGGRGHRELMRRRDIARVDELEREWTLIECSA
jgi:hypothetical protein